MIRRRLAAAAALLACVVAPLSRGEILVSMTTNKAAYRPGEALDISITATNTAAQDVVLHFSDGRQAEYVLDGVYHWPEAWTLALTSRTIPANSSFTWTFRHNWDWRDLTLGAHAASGQVIGRGQAGPVNFDVVAPTLPTTPFTIDFEHAPGGGGPVQSVTQYWPQGVHFRSIGAGLFPNRPGIYDGHLAINTASYPPGFNIVADFDMPVHGVAADVSAAAGVKITLIAKDKAGNILDTAVSDPVAVLGSYVPVSVNSSTPIASVEWWPSNERSTVIVDNVAISMPEPGGMIVLVWGGLLLLRRSRG
jgi:hypothetical protein